MAPHVGRRVISAARVAAGAILVADHEPAGFEFRSLLRRDLIPGAVVEGLNRSRDESGVLPSPPHPSWFYETG